MPVPIVDAGVLQPWKVSNVAGIDAPAMGLLDTADPSNAFSTASKRSMLIVPHADGDNNGTFRLRLYGAKLVRDNRIVKQGNPMFIPALLYTITTVTLGAQTGVADGVIPASQRFADTLSTLTKSTLAGLLETSFGKSAINIDYVPISGTQVSAIWIPDTFNFHHIFPDVDTLSNVTDVNFLISTEQ